MAYLAYKYIPLPVIREIRVIRGKSFVAVPSSPFFICDHLRHLRMLGRFRSLPVIREIRGWSFVAVASVCVTPGRGALRRYRRGVRVPVPAFAP